MKIIQYLINGISIGSVYAIIALGYTMVYGIAKMLNFAHGDVIMVGAYISFCVTNYLPAKCGAADLELQPQELYLHCYISPAAPGRRTAGDHRRGDLYHCRFHHHYAGTDLVYLPHPYRKGHACGV